LSDAGRYCCFNCPEYDDSLKRLTDTCPTCGKEYGFPLSEAPLRIGRYNVERPLGRGFYGAAFVGRRDGPIRTPRVLKISPKAMYERFRKSFEEEIQLHASVAEGAEFVVGIADMFDADVDFNGLIIPCHVAELEYLEGEPLQDYLSGKLPLTAAEAAQIACDLFEMREEFELRLKHHNDLHGANIVVARLPKAAWRRGDPIEPGIRAVAIDLGSVAGDRRSGDGYVGDLHWIGKHIELMADRLLSEGNEAGDREKRMALKLYSIAQSVAATTENQRPPSADDFVRMLRDEYFQVAETWRPWRTDLRLRRFEESYNAQTLDAWYVPRLLVDPENSWVARVSAPGPLVMTGMRGCGKTMLLQSVQFHARAAVRSGEADADALRRVASDGYVGLFVSAQRLIPVSSYLTQPSPEELYARLLTAYAAAAARSLAHLANLDPSQVRHDAPAAIAKAVGQLLAPEPDLPEPATIEQLERYLIDLLVKLSRTDSPYRLATTPPVAFPHLAEAIRAAAPVWRGSQVLFLLDDVSTRYLDKNHIEELLSALIFQHPSCAFKITSEAQTIFLTLKSPGQVHPAAAGRDFQAFDLGAEVYERLKKAGGRDFINEILRARARFYPGHPSAAPKDVLGDVDLESIARSIVSTQPNSNIRKRLYRGLSALAGVCVGDIGSVIQIYQLILAKSGKTFPVPAQHQNAAFQDFCARYLYHLDRRESELKAVAMSFAEASYQLLMQSGKDPDSKRLRQYTSIYVRITSGDVEGQMGRLRDLVDAGIFVFTGAAPRTKTRDSNPTQQFQLSYRKIFGLVNFIGLSERDRFELSGEGLQEWLTKPADGKAILLRNLEKPGSWNEEPVEDEHGDEAAPREFDRAPPLQLAFPDERAVDSGTPQSPDPIPLPSIFRSDGPGPAVGTLVVGLGFEDRAPVSLERILSVAPPERILAVRYPNPGHAERMRALAAAARVPLEEIDYRTLGNDHPSTFERGVMIDVTGLAKPALFRLVRSAVERQPAISIAYTQAELYSPGERELAAVLDAHASYNRHETLAALKTVLTGEQGPYTPQSLLTTEADGTRTRGLFAFASAKHERILHLMEAREYDAVELMVDRADTARAKVGEMAARVALEECRSGEIVSADVCNLEEVLAVLARRYRDWYIDNGLNFELGLTGNKIEATAAAILTAVLPVNEVWYVGPTAFDEARFTKGVGSSAYFRVERRDFAG
jgi:hypothetical protein